MIKRWLAVLSVVIACDRTPVDGRPETQPETDGTLIGAWDAKLSLSHGYQLAGEPSSRAICGTIGFVDNRHGAALVRSGASGLGVYDLDLSRLGLNWLADKSYPEAVETSLALANPGARRDSVTIILNPNSAEKIVLVGRRDAEGVNGEWLAQSLRGTATGRFSLRPHGVAGPSC